MVAYRSILGFELELTPWLGRNVAFLTPPDRVLDPAAMGRLLAAVDAAWDLQVALNGRQPVPLDDHRLDGRTVIAVVPQSCGAGCGYLGGTGIELQDRWFDYLHAGLVAGIGFDQIVFYELGRNFWFYGDQLNPLPGIATGFAIATRFVGMEALALPGAPVDGLRPFESVEQAVRHELMGAYLADPALDWANTLALGRMPAHPAPLSQADFAAGMLLRIAEDFGLAGYGATLRALAARPEAFTASEATANLMAAVRGATGIDYTPLLKTGWQVAAAGLGGGLLDLGLGPAGPLPLAAFGLLGDDLLRAGGTGAFLAGGAGADGLAGGAGADTLIGGTGADRLDGGGGDDLLFAGPGADTVAGGDGADTLRYAAGAALTVTALPDGGWLVEDGYGPDLLLGVEFLAVGDGAAMPVALAAAGRPLPPTAPYTAPAGPQLQTRHGTSGADDLEGGAAGDLLIGHCGADRIAGRRGDDAVEAGCGGDVANGHQGADTLRGGTGADSLGGGSGNDLLDGGADADRLLGHDGADRLDGGSGDDWLFGGTGDDTLTGGEGADTLKGGDGADVFVIDGAAGGIDVVVEFEAGTDRLDLSALRARGGAPRLVQDGDDLRLEADGLTLAVIRDAAPADLALL